MVNANKDDEAFNKIIEDNNLSKGATQLKKNSVSKNDENKIKDEEYFNDDELFLSDDEIVMSEDAAGAIAQLENVITWEIDKLYKNDGELKSRYSLRVDPPVFRMKSSDGSVAEFVLTRELSEEFHNIFANVDKAYDGVDGRYENSKKDMTFNERINELFNNAREHPGRSIVLIILALFILYSIVF